MPENEPKDQNVKTDPKDEGQKDGADTNPQLHTIKVNGQERQVTYDELLQMAQKGEGADAKFREAAKYRQLWDDMQAVKSGDVTAFTRVMRAQGYADEDIQTMLAQAQGAGDPSPTPRSHAPANPESGAGSGDDDELAELIAEIKKGVLADIKKEMSRETVDFKRLSPEVQDALKRSTNDKMMEHLRNSVDKDSVLGEYIRYADDKQKKYILSRAQESVGRRLNQGQNFWNPDTVAKSLQEVRQELADLGFTPRNKPRVPLTGLGPSSSSSTGDPIHPERPPVRPKEGSTDVNKYGEYLMQKLQHAMLQDDDD